MVQYIHINNYILPFYLKNIMTCLPHYQMAIQFSMYIYSSVYILYWQLSNLTLITFFISDLNLTNKLQFAVLRDMMFSQNILYVIQINIYISYFVYIYYEDKTTSYCRSASMHQQSWILKFHPIYISHISYEVTPVNVYGLYNGIQL